MTSSTQWWAALVAAQLLGSTSAAQETPCQVFRDALEPVPHTVLLVGPAPIAPIWPGEPAPVCEVRFETTDSLSAGVAVPDFIAERGSALFEAGWRMIPEILADGAGSGIHAVQKGQARCVVAWEQPAYLDDDGTHVQSDTLTMVVQCSGAWPSRPRA